MKIERDERKFDFHGIGLAIKKAREREGMTQEQLGYIVDRDPRTIILHCFFGQVTFFAYFIYEHCTHLHKQDKLSPKVTVNRFFKNYSRFL